MFRLDAKIINYAPGLTFPFVKEINSGQNGLSMSLKNATVGVVFLGFGFWFCFVCFLKKALHRVQHLL